MKIVFVSLVLYAFFALPASAAPACSPSPSLAATAPVEDANPLADLFGDAGVPHALTVSCDSCTQPRGPAFQCNRHCRSLGLCVDQCYADDACQSLVACICLSC